MVTFPHCRRVYVNKSRGILGHSLEEYFEQFDWRENNDGNIALSDKDIQNILGEAIYDEPSEKKY